ncbi:MAG TPA: lipopolysaccharide kinase InaA family protein, partial [Candidatus Binataceae bacterium]|nr:lipopolysaccharide kinase InaA family protein [Candidatus Binataceae bacterium]
RPFRRSRHASTWLARIEPLGEVFIKQLDPPTGLAALGASLRKPRVRRVGDVVSLLRCDGFEVPQVLLTATHRDGRELIVTARAAGFMLPRAIRERAQDLARKRTLLRDLGREIARLHRSGYLHGDLTPFNVLIPATEPARFTLIDHERTRRTLGSRFTRARLRNLVQLGHFEFPGVTRSDRMRVWRGYSESMSRQRRGAELTRLVRMLEARRTRELRNIGLKLRWFQAPK